MSSREQLAKDNGMTIEFVNWFFDNKKDGCGNAWLVMMAAMWESWKHLSEQRDALAAENAARKSAAKKVIKMNRQHAKDQYGNPDIAESWACVKALRQVNTPATDDFLREVKAQGAEACVKALATSDDDDFTDAPNICACVAYQLRQGGAA